MPTVGLVFRRAALTVVLAALAAPAASAHPTPQGDYYGYVTTFSNLEPLVLGVNVVTSGDHELLVNNLSGKTIVVLGNEGEPYLRFSPDGVYRNRVSPTTYVNLARDENLELPPGTDSLAPPSWEKVGDGKSFKWLERRIGWSDTQPPDVVERQPDTRHFIGYWQIPATADGQPFLIKGFLGYTPPPPQQGGIPSRKIAVGALAGFLLASGAAATILVLRRRRMIARSGA